MMNVKPLLLIAHVLIVAAGASQSILAQDVAKDRRTSLLTQLGEQASAFRFAAAKAETEAFKFEPKALLHY